MPTLIPAYPTDLQPYLSAVQDFPALFAPRTADSHKGSYGTLAVIGGCSGMSGAIVLAASTALYNGCGKVWAGFRQPSLPMPLIPERPEIMLATADVLLKRSDITAWVCGCGFGVGDGAAETLAAQLQSANGQPLLLDADALNLLAQHPHLSAAAQAHKQLVLTPHPAEAARLLSCRTADIQADRAAAVHQLAEQYQAIVVLKGHHTLVAAPQQAIYTNLSGNPGLATAGSGDVLSGLIGSLLAQGIPAWQAVCGGVWLHGAAADVLRDAQVGEIGLLAGEIAAAARWLRNQLIRQTTS